MKAYEDVLRHVSDRRINKSPTRILHEGEFLERKWSDIKCGNIIEVTSDQAFPCDLVLLYSDTDDGVCHITTANLDGETNLKVSP
jgi:P-type E1-E2 ATPase